MEQAKFLSTAASLSSPRGMLTDWHALAILVLLHAGGRPDVDSLVTTTCFLLFHLRCCELQLTHPTPPRAQVADAEQPNEAGTRQLCLCSP